MALTDKQMSHPKFPSFNRTANRMVLEAVRSHGFSASDLEIMETQTGRLVDEMVSLLLRMEKSK